MTRRVCIMHATGLPVLSSFILVRRSGHDLNEVSIIEENRHLTTDY